MRLTKETFHRGLLLEHLPSKTLYKMSEPYETHFTAQVVFPLPSRTQVHTFEWSDGMMFAEPSKRKVEEMDAAWGFATPTR